MNDRRRIVALCVVAFAVTLLAVELIFVMRTDPEHIAAGLNKFGMFDAMIMALAGLSCGYVFGSYRHDG